MCNWQYEFAKCLHQNEQFTFINYEQKEQKDAQYPGNHSLSVVHRVEIVKQTASKGLYSGTD